MGHVCFCIRCQSLIASFFPWWLRVGFWAPSRTKSGAGKVQLGLSGRFLEHVYSKFACQGCQSLVTFLFPCVLSHRLLGAIMKLGRSLKGLTLSFSMVRFVSVWASVFPELDSGDVRPLFGSISVWDYFESPPDGVSFQKPSRWTLLCRKHTRHLDVLPEVVPYAEVVFHACGPSQDSMSVPPGLVHAPSLSVPGTTPPRRSTPKDGAQAPNSERHASSPGLWYCPSPRAVLPILTRLILPGAPVSMELSRVQCFGPRSS